MKPSNFNSELSPEITESKTQFNPYEILTSCRNVDNYKKLNRIEEGTYGVVCKSLVLLVFKFFLF